MSYTLRECQDALKACEKLHNEAQSQVMRDYWSKRSDMWQRRLRNVQREDISAMAVKCPTPDIWGQDEYHCSNCGMVWDRNEEKPNCLLKRE